jgi:hypothetical protein
MTTHAVIAHHMPGRVRVRIPERRRDSEFFSTIEALLPVIEGVEEVETNPLTASVLIKFTGTLIDLFHKIREQIPDIDIQYPSQGQRARSSVSAVNMPVVNIVSGRKINFIFMVGSVLTAVGLAQTIRGKILVPSISVFWYAMDAFRQAGALRK